MFTFLLVTWFTLLPVVPGDFVPVKKRKNKAFPLPADCVGPWLGGEAGLPALLARGPPAEPRGHSHWLTADVPSPHLSIQRTLKQDCDTGRILLLLVSRVLQFSCMHQGNRIFSAACPAPTGSKHPKYRASGGARLRPSPPPWGVGTLRPCSLFHHPQAKARRTQMKAAFPLWMAD